MKGLPDISSIVSDGFAERQKAREARRERWKEAKGLPVYRRYDRREMALALKEKDVSEQIVRYLQALGWTVVRQQSGLFSRPGSKSRIRIGEVGAADWYAVRSAYGRTLRLSSEFFYFELKAPGKKPSPEQLLWLDSKKRSGIPAEWFSGFNSFREWYSGNWGRHAGDSAGVGL